MHTIKYLGIRQVPPNWINTYTFKFTTTKSFTTFNININNSKKNHKYHKIFMTLSHEDGSTKVQSRQSRDPILDIIDFDSDFESESEIIDIKHNSIRRQDVKLSQKLDSFDFGDDDDDVEILRAADQLMMKKPNQTNIKNINKLLKRQPSSDIHTGWKHAKVENNDDTILPPSLTDFNGSSPVRIVPFDQMGSRTSSPIKSKVAHQMRTFSTLTNSNSNSTNTKPLNSKPKSIPNHKILFSTQRPTVYQEDDSSSIIKTVKPMILSSEQEYILNKVLEGIPLFYTGSAGTGKSVLLRVIIKELKNKFSEGVYVTASTGLAACNIGGTTLHSFAGVGLGDSPVSKLIDRVRKNKTAMYKWRSAKVLIIDEISMVDGEFFDKLDSIARKVRDNNKPFGGIQLVVCGDFYQLPPVVKQQRDENNRLIERKEISFAFDSYAWQSSIEETIVLTEVYRQKGDQKFIEMLNELRDGKVSEDTSKEFRKLNRELICPAGIVPAEIFATRREVDNANDFRLNKLPGETLKFNSTDGGSAEPRIRQSLLQNFLAPEELRLKKNAQVMYTYLKYKNGNPENEQGESDYIFDHLSSSDISNLSTEDILNRERKQEIERQFAAKALEDSDANGKKLPLVKFLLANGIDTRTVVVDPEEWKVEDDKDVVLASRVQIPLILAWSLSIHKSQGQTLPKVKVDLKRVFEKGQAYVALSRAVSREGLQVLNYDRSKIIAHPRVIRFYDSLTVIKSGGQSKLDKFYSSTDILAPSSRSYQTMNE
ncbi:PIF1-like helicase-domain-containing protein [Scheffersomyces amazonensis]|uniref:PIF1-like helicase-domain-containing protein n=1 Tax=Scheffersomyces amazonensis TaxID=1078765 RepID=UPI00315CC5FB